MGNPEVGSPFVGRGFGYSGPTAATLGSDGLGMVGTSTGCKHCKYTCVPEEYMKKKTKVCYTCGCEPFCVDFPYGLFRKCSCDGCSRQPSPRIRKYLIKQVHTTECPATRCVPAPGCDSGCGSCEGGACAGGSCGAAGCGH
jgi:hypothetical protein